MRSSKRLVPIFGFVVATIVVGAVAGRRIGRAGAPCGGEALRQPALVPASDARRAFAGRSRPLRIARRRCRCRRTAPGRCCDPASG